MFKRPVLVFAVAGTLIPFILITFQEVSLYFNPNYIGSGQLWLFMWPSSIMLMALHGSQFWSWDTVLIYAISIFVNVLLYAFIGSIVAAVWFLFARRPLPAFRIFLLSGIALVIGFALTGMGRPVRYELPEGYQGWVVIEYYNPDCAPIESKGIFLVITVPPSGRVCTSSPLPDDAWRLYLYEHLMSDSTRRRIPSFNNKARAIWGGNYLVFQTKEEGFPQYGFFVGGEKENANRPPMPYTKLKSL
jgi:hypothetical protein